MKKIYSQSSDIWSLGIVFWEILSFGCVPYGGLTNKEVIDQITTKGCGLTQPQKCSSKIYSIIQR